MNDRLSPEAAHLVRAGRSGLGPSRRDVDRLRARILVGAAAGAASTLAGAGAAGATSGGGAAATGAAAGSAATGAAAVTGAGVAAGGLGVLKVVAVVVTVAGASVTGGVLVTRSSHPQPIRTSDSPVLHPHRDPVTAPDSVPVGPEPHPDPDPVSEPAPQTVRSPPSRKPRSSSLSDELALLRRARAALRSGAAQKALAELDRHAREVKAPRLAPEAAAIRIEATCAAGDRHRARQLAEEFLARWPDSPLARRIPKLCGGTP